MKSDPFSNSENEVSENQNDSSSDEEFDYEDTPKSYLICRILYDAAYQYSIFSNRNDQTTSVFTFDRYSNQTFQSFLSDIDTADYSTVEYEQFCVLQAKILTIILNEIRTSEALLKFDVGISACKMQNCLYFTVE